MKHFLMLHKYKKEFRFFQNLFIENDNNFIYTETEIKKSTHSLTHSYHIRINKSLNLQQQNLNSFK